MLRDYYTPLALEDGYEYCENGKDYHYFCPPETDFNGYLEYVSENLPLTDPPTVFGLHQNA
jgi:hypothetical protein